MNMSLRDAVLRHTNSFWQLVPGKAPGTAELYIYSTVCGDTEDPITGKKTSSKTSADHFRQELDRLKDVSQINIYINSNGGNVKEGLGIYSQLKRHKAHKTAYIDGYACSIASVIPMACDEVVMSPPATMMIHPAWSIAVGNAGELRKCADDLDKITESTKQAYLNKSGGRLTMERLTEIMNAETWLTAKECIEYGLVDRILGAEEALPEPPDKQKEPDKEKESEDFTDKAMSIIGNFFM